MFNSYIYYFTQIPDNINNLSELSYLDIRNTGVETLPEEMGDLESLATLRLQDNSQLTNVDPISGLTNLTYLNLQYNELTSLPDDIIHYSQPRILTVREWARFQTFPDWYQFAGKRTTGGIRRAGNPHLGIWDREVPKYTQIGNAVAVLLAKQIGKNIKKIIS